MTSPRRPFVKRWTTRILDVLDRLIPPADEVLLHSQPDLDDSIVALLRNAPADLTVRVLVDDLSRAHQRRAALRLQVPLVARRTPRGLRAYLRARITVTTHGLYGSPRRRRGRHVIGLWHGEFGKLVGHLIDEPHRHFDWMPVSSELSRSLRIAEFRLPRTAIQVVGSPRQELLAGHTELDGQPYVVWAPTYRTTRAGRARVDGDPDSVAELAPDDPDLLELLERYGVRLWYRPHPSETTPAVADSSPVKMARDRDLEPRGLTFYELLGGASALLTDYSSLWIDWLLRDRPLLAYCPDLEEYRRTRGIALEPHEHWFPGPVVRRREELLACLDKLLSGEDPDADRRRHTRSLLHKVPAVSPVMAVWTHVGQVLNEGAP